MDHYVLLLYGLYLVFLDHCGYCFFVLVFITRMMLIMYVFMYIHIHIYIYMHIDIDDDDDDDDDDYGIQSFFFLLSPNPIHSQDLHLGKVCGAILQHLGDTKVSSMVMANVIALFFVIMVVIISNG